MAGLASLDEVNRTVALAVDPEFYRAVYVDLEGSAFHPATHYATTGWREGRDPAPWFSTREYLRLHPDVAEAGVNPLHHFLTCGRREGREIVGSAHARAYLDSLDEAVSEPAWRCETGPAPVRGPVARPGSALRPLARAPDDYAVAASGFDAAFYLARNLDVAESGQDPLEHFLTFGWREGRDPNPRFSVNDYLENNADVAAAGVNPLVHYLRAGKSEGRPPRNSLGFRYDVIARSRPIPRRIAEALAVDDPPLGAPADLVAALARSRSGLRDLHVTFSHDDYSANVGGLQVSLQREASGIRALGRDHLHLYPAKPWPVVRAGEEMAALGVVWNGEAAGFFLAADVAAALAEAMAAVEPGARSFAVHSLLGHRADEVSAVLAAVGLKAGYFWLHDFASLCAGFHLLRDDVADCGAPPIGSAACRICIYGPYRARHVDEHRRLFEALDLTVLAPSQSALDTWRRGGDLPAQAERVHPHVRMVERTGRRAVRQDGPLRFAFLGVPSAHKGWPIFRELALDHADDPRYQFLHLAQIHVPGLPIAFHDVKVTAARPFAMRDAVERLGIDVVLAWSLCRETFGLTAFEAAAAGAAILAGPDSGNVAAFAEESGLGRVLADEASLAGQFKSGEVLDLARSRRRPALYDLAFSGLTADLLAEGAA